VERGCGQKAMGFLGQAVQNASDESYSSLSTARIEYKIIKTNVCVKQPVKKTQQPVKKSGYY
jgi:hypothetical protein